MAYERTLEDELDWKIIDQLDGAVAKISSNCFEIKKICVTTLFVVLALLAKFIDNHIDRSIFIAGLAVPVVFWLLDSIGYYYQENIRCVMENIIQRLNQRNKSNIQGEVKFYVINETRAKRKKISKIFFAGFNSSMVLYLFIVIVDIVVWLFFRV